MYYVIAPTNSDIYHHGILGQKWGKQNGPPYPLSGSDHSAAERKAGLKKSLEKANKSKNKMIDTNNMFDSSSYNKKFLDYCNKKNFKPEMIDDPELMELVIMEYEEGTGKKAMKQEG